MPLGSNSGFERVAIVTGLEAEARIARRLGRIVAVGGGTPEGARGAARTLIERGATALISFGLAGGLDPSCAAGALLVPRWVRFGEASFATDAGLCSALGGATIDGLLGASSIAVTALEKARLWQESRCAGIDLETGIVAQLAGERALPFAALRAVCDPAGMGLPPVALLALSAEGQIGLPRVLGSLAREPRQIAALLALGVAAARARAALTRRVGAIGAPLRIDA